MIWNKGEHFLLLIFSFWILYYCLFFNSGRSTTKLFTLPSQARSNLETGNKP